MSAHAVGAFNFEFWDGEKPSMVQRQASSHTRPGANGIAHSNLGIWGREFQSALTMHIASFGAGLVIFNKMRVLVAGGPVPIVYNYINYRQRFRHVYNVKSIEMLQLTSRVRLIGPSYDFLGGAELVVGVKMSPQIIQAK